MTSPHETARLDLPPILDLQTVGPLALDLQARRGQPLILDASQVERLGGLGLQVLLSARMTWARDRLPFAIDARSAAFDEALALCGANLDAEPGAPS